MTMTFQEQVNFFFAPPLPPQVSPCISTLHLARREALECLIGDVIPEDAVTSHPRKRCRLFATTMVIMSGTDLLAKFYAGADDNRGSGERFQHFLKTFMLQDESAAKDEYAEVLNYGCRNPIGRSFTLHQTKFSITLTDRPSIRPVFPHAVDQDSYVVSVEGLYMAFLKAVSAYETALRADAVLQSHFAVMFPFYGSVRSPSDDHVSESSAMTTAKVHDERRR
jgi:hypothetical protein